MHANRYIEFHSQVGNYHTIRTPRQGRDFDYRYSSCDLYCVGATYEKKFYIVFKDKKI